MVIYTIGYEQSAERFFALLEQHDIRRLVDVRLNPASPSAGFAKCDDLAFFLGELSGVAYCHEPLLAPSYAMLERYRRGGTWAAYERSFLALMGERAVERRLEAEMFAAGTVVLCAERAPERCHRRLAIEYLSTHWGGIATAHL